MHASVRGSQMLFKNRMIKDVITINFSSPMLETGNRRDPLMVHPSGPDRLKWISRWNRPSRKKTKKT
jgi:hypothetical protein